MVWHRDVGSRSGGWVVAIGFTILSLLAAGVRAATPEQVDKAIDKGKAALWNLAKAKGGIWDDRVAPANADPGLPSQWGGTTALCSYALLAAGENRDDPKFKPPIDFLLNSNRMTGIYAIGMRANVWPFLNTRSPEILKAVARDYKLLHSAVHEAPDARGVKAFYRYTVASSDYDHSASQYGVLGMWAIDEVGGEIPLDYWNGVEAGWRKHQNIDGGWGYTAGTEEKDVTTPTMTAAGVATLFITQDFLHSADGVNCPGNIVDKNIDRGLAWMAKHFDEYTTNKDAFRFYYGLYGLERIGVASGYKYFGTNDWYEQGADLLVKSQGANGSWGNSSASDTAFSLLFLVRGRAPVAINKLQYTIEAKGAKPTDKPVVANWNQRSRDAANITHWITKQTERFLNWQITNLDASVEDLNDAPLLYLAGNQTLAFKDKDMDKLRQYVQEGGLIVGNADCNNQDFVKSFEALGKKLFNYDFANLPPSSPVFSEQFPGEKWANKPMFRVLTNGSRIFMVMLPSDKVTGDFSRNWQVTLYGGHEESFQFLDNLFLYAIDRGEKGGLENKGETYLVRRKEGPPTTQQVKVARLKYDGNWNPEPAGWTRLGAILHNDPKTAFDLDVKSVELGKGELAAGGFKIAHLTGTDAITLSPAATDELKKFVAGGGKLVVDACGGNSAFAGAMEQYLPALAAGGTLEPIATGDVVLAKPFAVNTAYRRFARKTLGNLHSARLKVLKINGHAAVYFSAEDLSTGLVGQQVDGIVGYAPETAVNIMANLASTFVQLPTTRPATKPSTKSAAATKPAAAPK